MPSMVGSAGWRSPDEARRSDTSAATRPASSDKRLICFPFAGGLAGGSHISAIGLIKAIGRRGYEPLVVLHRTEGALADLLRHEEIAFEKAPTSFFLRPDMPLTVGNAARALQSVAGMWRFLRERRIGIVHTNDGLMHATWTVPARLSGAAHVWHHRGSPAAASLRSIAPLTATHVVSVSRYAMSGTHRWRSLQNRSSVVYSPFDTSLPVPDRVMARSTLAAELNVAADARLLAFVGHFSHRKRPLVFVEAIASLRRRRSSAPQVVGLLFGEDFTPGLAEQVRVRAGELGITDSIRLMGFRRPIEPVLAAVDALIVPAVDEPFGRTLIEAMLVGTPVIAAAHGGNMEAIRHGHEGLLATPDDPDSFADRIEDVLDSPGLAARLASQGRYYARQTFGLNAHVQGIEAVYREILAA